MQPVIPEPSYLKSILLSTTQNSQLPNPVISNATSAETVIKSINNNISEDLNFSTTFDISKTGHKEINYFISPIRGDESYIDDSDADPYFHVSPKKKIQSINPLLLRLLRLAAVIPHQALVVHPVATQTAHLNLLFLIEWIFKMMQQEMKI